jgi:acetyl esterase/lipase
MKTKILFIVILLLSIAACSVNPQQDYTIEKDVEYGEASRQIMDIYYQKEGENKPIAVIVHGGAWEATGSKENMKSRAIILAQEGFVSFTPDYRQEFGVDQYPTNFEDVACSIAWAKEHAEEYNADPNNVVLIGYSAGTYSTAMIAFNKKEDWLKNCDSKEQDLEIVGYVRMSGGMSTFADADVPSVAESEQEFIDTFAPGKTREELAPDTYIDSTGPQTLLIHGDADQKAPLEASIRFSELLEENGVEHTFYIMEGAEHTGYTNREDFQEQLTTFANEVTNNEN